MAPWSRAKVTEMWRPADEFGCKKSPTASSANTYIPYFGTACEIRQAHPIAVSKRENQCLEFELAFEILAPKRDWASELALKRTTDDVLALVREFVEKQEPAVWHALLPEHALPSFTTIEEVGAYAVALMQREFKLAGETAARCYEFVAFFSGATQRLAQLTAPREQGHPFFSRDAYLASTPDQ